MDLLAEDENKQTLINTFLDFYSTQKNSEQNPAFDPFTSYGYGYINSLNLLLLIFGNQKLNNEVTQLLKNPNFSFNALSERWVWLCQKISDDVFAEILEIKQLHSANKNVLFEIFLRASQEQLKKLLSNNPFLIQVFKTFKPTEIIGVVLGRLNSIELNQVLSLNFIKLIFESGAAEIWDYVLPKVSPFKFKSFDYVHESKTLTFVYKNYYKGCGENLTTEQLDILDFINSPTQFISKKPDRFMELAATYLNADDTLTDVVEWKTLLLQAKSACPKKRLDIIEQIDFYLRKLNKRPELAQSSGAVSSSQGAWFVLKDFNSSSIINNEAESEDRLAP